MINNVSIAIKDSNRAKIEEAIAAAQGRARVRLLTYDDMISALEVVEGRLSISKCAMTGTRVTIDVNAETFCNAYRAKCFRPESTWFECVRTTSGWTLVKVWRGATAASTRGYHVNLSESAREAVLRRVMAW